MGFSVVWGGGRGNGSRGGWFQCKDLGEGMFSGGGV